MKNYPIVLVAFIAAAVLFTDHIALGIWAVGGLSLLLGGIIWIHNLGEGTHQPRQ